MPIPIGETSWEPGDVVLDAKGRIRVRSSHPHWVWGYPNEGERGQIPEGSLAEDEVERPLVLLVRDGHAINSVIAQQ
jgi:hypothetical protein